MNRESGEVARRVTSTGEPDELSGAFSQIAPALLSAETVDELLERVVGLAVETVNACDYAAVSVVEMGGGISTPAASDDVAARCDALQYEFGEGPCVSAIWERQTFESEDLSVEERWPQWAPRAVAVGASSLMSFRLFVKANTLGALNLYARTPRSFDDIDRAAGAIFASLAAVALAGAQRQERFDGAIVIAKATGMLMERRGITSDQALDVLTRAARQLEVKVQEVAERVVQRRRPDLEGPRS